MTIDKILYQEAYKSPQIYGLNKGYWSKKVNSIINEIKIDKNDWSIPPFKNAYKWEEIPIYNFYSKKLKKSISIYQYSYNSYIESYKGKYITERYFTAWIDTIYINEKEIPRLAIYLVNTNKNQEIALKLIKLWLLNEIELLKKGIDKIYKGHE